MVIANRQQLVGANMESHRPGINYTKPTKIGATGGQKERGHAILSGRSPD